MNDGRDVGVLLLADHPRARHWELMYMGLVPEARGTGLGPANRAAGAVVGAWGGSGADCIGGGRGESAGAGDV